MTKNIYTLFMSFLGSISLFGLADLQANAVWVGNTDDMLENASNWAGNVLPNSSTIAEFGAQGTSGTSLETLTGFSALGILFDSNAPDRYYLYNDVTSTISIGLAGVVNNSPYQQELSNDSSGAGLLLFAGGSLGSNMTYSSYNSTTGGGVTFQSDVDGSGSDFIIEDDSTLTSNGNSSVGSLIVDETSNVVIASGSLTIGNLSGDDVVRGPISGPGLLVFSPTMDSGSLTLRGTNTYEGGTVVNGVGSATLYVSDGGLLPPTGPITINSGALVLATANQTSGSLSGNGGTLTLSSPYGLTVNQTIDQTYAGTLSGASDTTFTLGTLGSSTATKTLQLTGDSSEFTGPVVVNSGNLQVNNQLGASSITVNNGGTLSGTGTFGTTGNTTTIASGGTLSPGNSVGVVTNAGNQVFSAGSIFNLEQNGFTTGPVVPSTSLLIVDGTTTVNAAYVNLVTTNGYINFNTTQTFLTSLGAVTVNNGGFTLDTAGLAAFNPEAYVVTLSYDANNYYILTQTQFTSEAENNGGDKNAVIVATQIDSISNPSTPENLFMNGLALLPIPDFIDVLDDLSGAQYATEAFAAEVANRQFIRRLYDPIREIVTTEPGDGCCRPVNPYCQFLGLDGWLDIGGGERQINGRLGLKVSEWDVTLGFQKTFDQEWTVGVATSYEHDSRKYHSGNGSGSGYTWFGGLYGLYRPACYYVLADLAYGYTTTKVHRQVVLGGDLVDRFTGKPNVSQVTFYAEGGIDWDLCSFLVQPFFGLEVAGFYRDSFTESDTSGSNLALNIHKKDRTAVTTSLGAHLTNKYYLDVDVSLDLAWLYRCTDDNNFTSNFEYFGTDFTTYGKNIGHSSGEGAVTFSKDFSDSTRVYVEASGEVWSNAYTYSVLGGLQYTW